MRRAFFASGAVILRRYAAIATALRGWFGAGSGFRAVAIRVGRAMSGIGAAGISTTSGLVHLAGVRLRRRGGECLSPRITILVAPAANASTKETSRGFLRLSGGSGDLANEGCIYGERPGAFRPILADSLAFSVPTYVIIRNMSSVKMKWGAEQAP